MKAIDFTHLGGFPFTQNTLDWLQSSYRESLIAIAKKIGRGNPIILSGMVSSMGTAGATNVSDGFFYYNGDIVKFNASSYAALTGANVALITISTTTTTLTYNDSSTFGAIQETSGAVSAAASVTDATHVPLASMYQDAVIYEGGDPNGATVKFDRDATVFFSALVLSSISTITLDFTDAKVGASVLMEVTQFGAMSSKTVAFSGSFTDVNRTSLPYTSGSGVSAMLIKIQYLGMLPSGVHYIKFKGVDLA